MNTRSKVGSAKHDYLRAECDFVIFGGTTKLFFFLISLERKMEAASNISCLNFFKILLF